MMCMLDMVTLPPKHEPKFSSHVSGKSQHLKFNLFCFLIFLLVGLKVACMSNFSFVGFLEVAVLWLEKNKTTGNSVELEASLAPDEAGVWAVAKADQ